MIPLGKRSEDADRELRLTIGSYFIGGTVLNRPGLVQFGNTIVYVTYSLAILSLSANKSQWWFRRTLR